MKLEKTAREILVTLSLSDQEAFGIRYDTMSFSDLRTRRFCEYMAVLVCLREGVQDSESISVRAVENASGELLLYFSCPCEAEKDRFSQVLEFFDVNGFLDCRSLFPSSPDLCAEVYFFSGKYYLWYEFHTSPDIFGRLASDLAEFGTVSCLDRCFLCEHGTLLTHASAFLLN